VSDLFAIRDFIAANSDNAAELRARWQNESAQPEKESKPVTVSTSNFLTELVAEQVELSDALSRAAKAQADESERIRIKSLNSELKRHFGKLLDKGVGSVEAGEFRFAHAGTDYSVKMSNGNFVLATSARVIAQFGVDGDAVTSLAKVLAKQV
jgi:hypothetical protein